MRLVLTMTATFKAVQADVKVATATYATVVVRYLLENSPKTGIAIFLKHSCSRLWREQSVFHVL